MIHSAYRENKISKMQLDCDVNFFYSMAFTYDTPGDLRTYTLRKSSLMPSPCKPNTKKQEAVEVETPKKEHRKAKSNEC